VMRILRDFSPDHEVYSIDECFLDLTGFQSRNLIEYGRTMRQRVLQWTGLPVCVGIGASKTLAKIANHIAKKNPVFNGVCDLNAMSKQELDAWLGRIKVGEVWGIGRRLAPQLQDIGINTVHDLQRADTAVLRTQFSVVMEKIICELNGIVCIELEEIAPPKKQIICSRSFGIPVTDLQSLKESITLYVSRAAEKLRLQQSYAGTLHVFIRTSPHNPKEPHYSNSMTVSLPCPTDDTRQLASVALWALKRIYRAGFRYQKSGVMLSQIVQAEGRQTDLFSAIAPEKSARLMGVLDQVNRMVGKQSLVLGSQGFSQPWKMKQGSKSPAYTSQWGELLVAR
jgi:DNA polymerase V